MDMDYIKMIVSIISALGALIPFIYGLIYSIYIDSHLTSAELSILPIKRRLNSYISIRLLFLLDLVLLIILSAFIFTNSLYWFLFCIVATFNFGLLLLLIWIVDHNHSTETYLIINNNEYKLLNRLDDDHISVRPNLADNKEIIILNISTLENHILREVNCSAKFNSEDSIISVILGTMSYLSSLMVLLGIMPEKVDNCFAESICILICVLITVYVYLKRKDKWPPFHIPKKYKRIINKAKSIIRSLLN